MTKMEGDLRLPLARALAVAITSTVKTLACDTVISIFDSAGDVLGSKQFSAVAACREGLARAPRKCAAVYDHVFTAYQSDGTSIYDEVG